MSDLSPRVQLSALYSAKREAGLIDVKFIVGSIDEASFDEIAQEVLRLEEAIDHKAFKVRRFNDKHEWLAQMDNDVTTDAVDSLNASGGIGFTAPEWTQTSQISRKEKTMSECNWPTCGCQNVHGAPWCRACLSIMSATKPNQPAEIMQDKTAQIENFKKSLVEGSGYFTRADTEKRRKKFGGSRITACGVAYEYGTHPLAALAMRERAAKACDKIAGNTADFPRDHRRAAGQCASAIRSLPTTFTDAELLAAAMQLPEVRALVEKSQNMLDLSDNYTGLRGEIYRDESDRIWREFRAALAPFKKGGE